MKRVRNRKKWKHYTRVATCKVYGITVEEYDQMFADQNGVCAICLKPETSRLPTGVRRLAIDHDHNSEKVRGLLCMHCNAGLGHFRDDVLLLNRALEYLIAHSRRYRDVGK